ncbi:YdcF family protein [Pedobacter panaciterrae]|uniref:YdcF family protein n=1 Tax=Pedobacter panaciterrae TaxID=363849 RepID=UPI00259640AF|nr:YdcF family protein [uncultured Pedobacter sp.]
MRILVTTLLFWLFIFQTKAQQNSADQSYQLIIGKSQLYNPYIQYKSYYLLTLIQELPDLRKAIAEDQVFQKLLKDKSNNAATALKTCAQNISCYADAMKFSEAEILLVNERLSTLYKEENVFGEVAKNHLLPSGCYGLFQDLPGQQLLIKAWEQDAKALNYAIEVYIEDKKPNYPKIDSIAFSSKDKEFPTFISSNVSLNTGPDKKLFFEPSMNFALGALKLNNRLEAADYEPMNTGVNQSAIAKIKKTNFKNYKYSVILVPGAGPEDRDTELSAGGMIRCRIAAIQYHKGVAPFIVVSGGRVHPYKTKYSEAYEMKKFLVSTLHIPENSIIMEPHARHTTTNLRNCIRLMFRYGMPMEKLGLISTIKSTIPYISGILSDRCKKELGYYPYKIGQTLSDTEVEFYPNSMSLQIDFDEPLDP